MELKDFKVEYAKLQKKYSLPSFNDLNNDFEIDKLDKDTDFLLRDIRKKMLEKIVNSIGFLEMLVNPMNAPRMYIPYIKSMTSEDKDLIDKMYGVFADISLMSLELEIEDTEKKEVELINHMVKTWNSFRSDFYSLVVKMRKPIDNGAKKEKSYYG